MQFLDKKSYESIKKLQEQSREFNQQQQYKKALIASNKSLTIMKENNIECLQPDSYLDMSKILLQISSYEKAKNCAKNAIIITQNLLNNTQSNDINQEIKYQYNLQLANGFSQLGICEKLLKKTQKSVQCHKKAFQIVQKIMDGGNNIYVKFQQEYNDSNDDFNNILRQKINKKQASDQFFPQKTQQKFLEQNYVIKDAEKTKSQKFNNDIFKGKKIVVDKNSQQNELEVKQKSAKFQSNSCKTESLMSVESEQTNKFKIRKVNYPYKEFSTSTSQYTNLSVIDLEQDLQEQEEKKQKNKFEKIKNEFDQQKSKEIELIKKEQQLFKDQMINDQMDKQNIIDALQEQLIQKKKNDEEQQINKQNEQNDLNNMHKQVNRKKLRQIRTQNQKENQYLKDIQEKIQQQFLEINKEFKKNKQLNEQAIQTERHDKTTIDCQTSLQYESPNMSLCLANEMERDEALQQIRERCALHTIKKGYKQYKTNKKNKRVIDFADINIIKHILNIQKQTRKFLQRKNTYYLFKQENQNQNLVFRGILTQVQTFQKDQLQSYNYLCLIHYQNISKQIKWSLQNIQTKQFMRCFIKKEVHQLKLINRPEFYANNTQQLRSFNLFMLTEIIVRDNKIKFKCLESKELQQNIMTSMQSIEQQHIITRQKTCFEQIQGINNSKLDNNIINIIKLQAHWRAFITRKSTKRLNKQKRIISRFVHIQDMQLLMIRVEYVQQQFKYIYKIHGSQIESSGIKKNNLQHLDVQKNLIIANKQFVLKEQIKEIIFIDFQKQAIRIKSSMLDQILQEKQNREQVTQNSEVQKIVFIQNKFRSFLVRSHYLKISKKRTSTLVYRTQKLFEQHVYRISVYHSKTQEQGQKDYLLKIQNKRKGEQSKDCLLYNKQDIDDNMEKHIVKQMACETEIIRNDDNVLMINLTKQLEDFLPSEYKKKQKSFRDPLYNEKMKVYRQQLKVYQLNNRVALCKIQDNQMENVNKKVGVIVDKQLLLEKFKQNNQTSHKINEILKDKRIIIGMQQLQGRNNICKQIKNYLQNIRSVNILLKGKKIENNDIESFKKYYEIRLEKELQVEKKNSNTQVLKIYKQVSKVQTERRMLDRKQEEVDGIVYSFTVYYQNNQNSILIEIKGPVNQQDIMLPVILIQPQMDLVKLKQNINSLLYDNLTRLEKKFVYLPQEQTDDNIIQLKDGQEKELNGQTLEFTFSFSVQSQYDEYKVSSKISTNIHIPFKYMQKRKFINRFKDEFPFQQYLDDALMELVKCNYEWQLSISDKDQEMIVEWIDNKFKDNVQAFHVFNLLRQLLKRQIQLKQANGKYEHLLEIDGYHFLVNISRIIGTSVVYLRVWLNTHWCRVGGQELVLCVRVKSSSQKSEYKNYQVVVKNLSQQRQLIDMYSQLEMLMTHIKHKVILAMKDFTKHVLYNCINITINQDIISLNSIQPFVQLYQTDNNNLPLY